MNRQKAARLAEIELPERARVRFLPRAESFKLPTPHFHQSFVNDVIDLQVLVQGNPAYEPGAIGAATEVNLIGVADDGVSRKNLDNQLRSQVYVVEEK